MFAHTVVVVPHVHWDREWYFTSAEAQMLAVKDITEIIEYLETHPEYPSFTLDGQMAFLDEYLNVMPHMRSRIVALVEAKRLHIGPWYTQTDEMAVGAEAIVRNLQFGLRSAYALGEPMMIGYIPDSFGQSAGMPKLLQGFNIHKAVFWRGHSEYSGTQHNIFKWSSDLHHDEAIDAWMMPLGYATGKYLSCDSENLRHRFMPLMRVLDEMSPYGIAILPHGHDQMPIQKNIGAALAALRQAFPDRKFILGSYDDAFELNKKAAEKSASRPLDHVQGELFWGKRERVHRSIGSVRMDILTRNVEAERQLVHEVEPLSVLVTSLGKTATPVLIDEAWKLLLENHAHDSFGGCCSDEVNAQVRVRAEQVLERNQILKHYMMRDITEAAAAPHGLNERLGLFNLTTNSTPRLIETELIWESPQFELVDSEGKKVEYTILSCEELDPGFVDRQLAAGGRTKPFYKSRIELMRALPPMGYEVIGIQNADTNSNQEAIARELDGDETYELKLDQYHFVSYAHGCFSVRGTDKTLDQLLGLIVCDPNEGDSYDFSPMGKQPIFVVQEHADIARNMQLTKNRTTISLSISAKVPKNLSAWHNYQHQLAYETAELNIYATYMIDKTNKLVDLKYKVCNTADNLRIRLLVPTGVDVEKSVADSQFTEIERPVVDPALKAWRERGWSERPDGIYPFLNYVHAGKATIFTASSREYEMVCVNRSLEGKLNITSPSADSPSANAIAITLLCGTGTLGASNLLRRPGRPSGIQLATPTAQMHYEEVGAVEHHFALYLGCEAKHIQPLLEWLSPVLTYEAYTYNALQLNRQEKAIPAKGTAICKLPEDLAVVAFKLPMHAVEPACSSAATLRLQNIGTKAVTLDLNDYPYMRLVNLNEDELEHGDTYTVQPQEIISIRLKLQTDTESSNSSATYRPYPVVGHVTNG